MATQLNFAQQMDAVLKELGGTRPRLLLHAETLTITHPAYGNAMTFRAPIDF